MAYAVCSQLTFIICSNVLPGIFLHFMTDIKLIKIPQVFCELPKSFLPIQGYLCVSALASTESIQYIDCLTFWEFFSMANCLYS